MEKINWTDRVRNGVIHRVKEEGNILHGKKMNEGKPGWKHLRRNCLIKQAVEGMMEGAKAVTGGRRSRCKQLQEIESGSTNSNFV
jgi:hypothetical protein